MSLTGTVKSFNATKGFGFIASDDGQDIFLHVSTSVDGNEPRTGDNLTFDVEPSPKNPKQMMAINVSGGSGVTGDKGAGKRAGIPGAHQGTVKSFAPKTGFGFAEGPDGKDVFVHVNACVDGSIPQIGDVLSFDIKPSPTKEGQWLAVNVSGGTGTENGKGGKNGAKGADAWGAWDGKGVGGWGKGDAWGPWGKGDAWGAWGKGPAWGPYGCGKGWGMDGKGWGLEGKGWGMEGKGWNKGWGMDGKGKW